MLEGGTEFVRELAVRDDDDTDHVASWVNAARPKAAIFVGSGAMRKSKLSHVREVVRAPIKAPVSI
jgi:hypothetical protein